MRFCINTPKDARDWHAFCRVLELMSFAEDTDQMDASEARQSAERICAVPWNAEASMNLEEAIFWAGVSTGIALGRSQESGQLDYEAATQISNHAAVFADSTRRAVIDLTLNHLEALELRKQK